jgi:dTDP-4-amino-4,6-dideoxygalactose transaminase
VSSYVAAWPGLAPGHVLRTRSAAASQPFPFSAPSPAFYYRERNALFHLFRALRRDDRDWALVPDYHHGSEIAAIRAAGFPVRFYPVGRDFTVKLEPLLELCEQRPRVLFLIHYLGWSQPLDEALAACRRLGIVTVEDCALSLLSADGDVALGSRSDHALFCLYKTLPVPNGGMLVHNQSSPGFEVRAASVPCGFTSLVSRTLTLGLEGLRNRNAALGGAVTALKERIGAALTRSGVRRWPIGDDGFDRGAADLRMSDFTRYLLDRLDYRSIRARRRENFARLAAWLGDHATPARSDLPPGMCPLSFPILVADKRRAADALWAAGIGAIEFWNQGDAAAVGARHADSLFLRRHVLELPIHQDVRPEQLQYMAETVRRLDLGMPRPV